VSVGETKVETIEGFAEKYRVRVKLDSCRDEIIPGYKAAKELPDRHEYRNHVYVHSDGKSFGVCLLFESPRKWTEAKKKLHAAGFAVRAAILKATPRSILPMMPRRDSRSGSPGSRQSRQHRQEYLRRWPKGARITDGSSVGVMAATAPDNGSNSHESGTP
jgi:hypothetical protein